MRVLPSVETGGNLVWSDWVVFEATISAWAVEAVDANGGVIVRATFAVNGAARYPGVVYRANGGIASYFALSAEL